MSLSRDDVVMRVGVAILAATLLVIVGLPLWSLLIKGFEDQAGHFVGLANYTAYFATPALLNSALNSFHVAAVCTVIVVPLAFLYAYALTRTVLPLRWLWQGIALIPIFAPSLLPGLLSASARNLKRGIATVRLFEIGRRYLADGEHPTVGVVLAAAARVPSSSASSSSWLS